MARSCARVWKGKARAPDVCAARKRIREMNKQRPAYILWQLVLVAAVSWLSQSMLQAGTPASKASAPPALYVSFIDRTSPQTKGPAINGLDERRRGPIFAAALQQCVQEGKLPRVIMVNKDLSVPSPVANERPVPAGKTLLRIYLTQWSHTLLGGIADTEILCRFDVEVLQDGRVKKKLGPFFAQDTFAPDFTSPQDRWAQFQKVALKAIRQMASAIN